MSFTPYELKALKMSVLSYLGLTLSIGLIITLVCGGSSHAEELIELTIPQGVIQGKVLKSREGKTFNGFMGIPYAQAPERFQTARLPPPTWEGTYDATNYREKCLQFNSSTLESEGAEDCLFINVFTPNTDDGNGDLSVLAFIHGGGFQFGLAYENGPEFFMDSSSVVYVTFSYRLAALGFLSTGDDVLPGNLGLKDQNLALKWIQENINFFGGNKNRVTLFGESAGGASVSFHILSPLSAGMFVQAISQSGSSLDRWAIVENPKPAAEQLAAKLNCPTGSSKEIIDCLKEKPGKDIMDVQLRSGLVDSLIMYGPVLETREKVLEDSAFLTEHPRILYEEGRFSRVPLILTFNDLEGLLVNALAVLASQETMDAFNNDWSKTAAKAFFLDKDYYSNESIEYATLKIRDFYFGARLVEPENLMNLTNLYTDNTFAHRSRLTAFLHSKYAPVYTAMLGFKGIWSQAFFLGFKEILGMTHADDLSYLFTDYKYPPFPPGSESEEFSKLLVKLWVDFANTGDPTYELDGEKWSPVEAETVEAINWLYLKNNPEFLIEPLKERMLLWDHIDQVLDTGIIPGKDEL